MEIVGDRASKPAPLQKPKGCGTRKFNGIRFGGVEGLATAVRLGGVEGCATRPMNYNPVAECLDEPKGKAQHGR